MGKKWLGFFTHNFKVNGSLNVYLYGDLDLFVKTKYIFFSDSKGPMQSLSKVKRKKLQLSHLKQKSSIFLSVSSFFLPSQLARAILFCPASVQNCLPHATKYPI